MCHFKADQGHRGVEAQAAGEEAEAERKSTKRGQPVTEAKCVSVRTTCQALNQGQMGTV